ncbi:hypothetical protein D9M71_504000 [compost metagenome]
MDAEAPGGVNQTLILVVEQPRDSQIKGVATGQGASLVTEAGGTHVEGRGGDQAFEVVQRLIDTQGQRLIAQQLAVTVVQTGGGQGVGLGTGEFTALVVDAIKVAQHQHWRGDQAVLIVQLATLEVQVQGSGTEQQTVLLIQARDTDGQCLVAGDAALVLVAHLRREQIEGIATG